MKRWIETFLHLIVWLSTSWLIATSFSIEAHEIELNNGVETVRIVRSNRIIFQILSCLLIAGVLFYVNAWIIIRLNKLEVRTQTIWYSAFAFFAALTLSYIVTTFRFNLNSPPLPNQIAFGIIIFYYALSIAYGLAKLWYFNHQRQQQLVLDKKQSELTLLRNQLQPHFLFNTLNNLLSMVDPVKNPNLVNSFERLSQLLRYVIEETNSDKVSIKKEIGFLKNYIDLQLLRFSEKEVNVQFNVLGQYDSQKVEPGLFIDFVENAFKYGTEPEATSTIDIEFDVTKKDVVQFKISNPIMIKNGNGNGTGIETTKKRLDLIYRGKHQLTVSDTDCFIVQLNLTTV